MRRWQLGLGILALIASGMLAASCGNDSGSTASVPATKKPGGVGTTLGTTPAVNPTFGPTPEIKDNIEKIFPTYGQKLTQAATRTADPGVPRGVCVQVNFKGLDGNAQWFRMALDGAEVTQKLSWAVDSFDNPTAGRVCYSPAEGFTIGRHFVAVEVRDPRNGAAQSKQIASWGFEVTP